MRIVYLLLLLLHFNISYAIQINKTPVPAWVQRITLSDKKIVEGNGGFQYLLIDMQDHLKQQTIYRHYAVQVLNAEGIQSMSDIDVTFDPTYQKLRFHEIRLIRGGQIIDKLRESKIQTFQREKSMERSLYDGSLSAVVNLMDVRENDIIEYAYSILGFNPIHQGHYSTTLYHQHTIPVNRIYNRVIATAERNMQFKLYEGASKPVIQRSDQLVEYIWDVNGLNFKLYDNQVPAWYDPHQRVSLTTFQSWQEVVNWALPLYHYTAKESAPVKAAQQKEFMEINLLKLIRLVQDDIRYLGFESGISAYKPHAPLQVYKQRYGDCKDKSLLLVSLLRKEGVAAYPLLVNTQLRSEIKNQLPSHHAFDHCIVYFNYEGKNYFVDPTLSNQGGNFAHMANPEYEVGLLLKRGNAELIAIPAKNKPGIAIKELITVDSIGGGASLVARTEYTGSKADHIRSYFNTSTKESIQKEYLNYYSNLYTDIETAGELKFYDYDRNSTNKIVVEEYYHLTQAWQQANDGSYIYCETYPLVLESQISYANTSKRTMPYYMGTPYSFSQIIQVELPEDWPVQQTQKRVEGEGFAYENSIKGYGKTVSISHHYRLDKEYLTADAVAPMLKKHEDIQKELSYSLTYNESLSGFSLSWVSVLLAFVAVAAGVFFSIRLYRRYDPEAWKYAEDKSIGSWLILPAIGLSLSPFMVGTQIFSAQYFNQQTWQSIFSSSVDQSAKAGLFIGLEIVYNFLFLVFSILVLIVFFKRRTSAPILVSIFYAVSLIGPLIDWYVAEELFPGQLSSSDQMAAYKDLGRSFIAAAIWIPYFNISERVKSTFCNRFNGQD